MNLNKPGIYIDHDEDYLIIYPDGTVDLFEYGKKDFTWSKSLYPDCWINSTIVELTLVELL